MITLLSRLFIKNYRDYHTPSVRTAYGILCGLVGIFLNVLLFAFKLAAGILSGSVAVTADAFNNLSDAGSSVITLIGFKLAAEKPDPAHRLNLEAVENDWYVTSGHEMTKPHHITFVALVTGDKLFLVKLYPEWGLGVRFPCLAHGQLYFYCTQHGLFSQHF